MILIIAEKPDMSRKIISALNDKTKKVDEGYESSTHIYTSCFGHLLKSKMPKDIDEKYKTWSLDTLPFAFNEIPLAVTSDTKKRFNAIKRFVSDKRVTEIVNACDADREGELIFRNLFELIKIPKDVKMSRMWIKQSTNEGIKESYEERQKLSLYDNIASSAKARAYADYIVGLNATQAMSVKFGQGRPLTVGRVQTPTLRIVVDREREIENFVSKPFWTVSAHANNETLIGDHINKNENGRFYVKENAEAVKRNVGRGDAIVTSVEEKSGKQSCEMLYSLASLQAEMNSRYKYTLQQTLDTCQALYERHSLISYPRTDEQKISPSMAKNALGIIKKLPIFKEYCNEILQEGYQINRKVISAGGNDIGSHEALTPVVGTITNEQISKLNNRELNVFNAIVLRFIQAFYPDMESKSQKVIFTRNNESFETINKVVTKMGYAKVLEKNSKNDDFLDLKENDVVFIDEVVIEESKTEPPKRFTERTLSQTMEKPDKYVDSKSDKNLLKEIKGIGTSATRAGIIEGLKTRELIEVNGREIKPTLKGMNLIDIIPSEIIKSVKLTANFETALKEIAEGRENSNIFKKKMDTLMSEFIEDIKKIETKKIEKGENMEKNNEVLCKCPNCGADIVVRQNCYSCSSPKESGCGTVIFVSALEKGLGYKKISKNQATELFATGKTKNKVKLKSKKTGKDYEAFLTYSYDSNETYPNKIWISFD